MSGNPFRASLPPPASTQRPLDESDSVETRFPPLDTAHATVKQSRTKKVRITSPPASPPQPASPERHQGLIRRLSSGHNAGSPPPSPPAADSSSDEEIDDPFERAKRGEDGDSTEDEVIRNTRRNSTLSNSEQTPASQAMIANPFRKTLATMEEAVTPSGPLDRGGHTPTSAAGVGKGAMDVDSFTKMLMGNAPAPSANTAAVRANQSKPHVAFAADSNSSTDDSSVSRQSIFEPVQEQRESVESPRTSYEPDEDERASLIGGKPFPELKKSKGPPPTPPKHKHGKLVQQRGPQTVSFADFSPSFGASPAPASPGATRPILQRQPSDLNKPLPAVPRRTSSEAEPIPLVQEPNEMPPTPPTQFLSNEQDTPVQQKRVPPTPPLARRHSQLRSAAAQQRSRSSSSLTLSSQTEEPESASAVPAATSSPPAQPTPPTSSSTDPASNTENIPPTSSSIATLSSPGTMQDQQPPKIAPPPPPTRRHGNTLDSVNRPSRSAFSSYNATGTSTPSPSRTPVRSPSISSQHRPMDLNAIASPPPPPPPRRGSGASKRSIEAPSVRRTSGEYGRRSGEYRRSSGEMRRDSMDEEGRRRKSGESKRGSILEEGITTAPEGGEGSVPPRDILADMDALQKEVENLRRAQEGRRVS